MVAYKAGSVVAGTLLLWVQEVSSWSTMWILFSLLYIICWTLIHGMSLGWKTSEEKKSEQDSETVFNLEFLINNWRRMLSVPGTRWMICYVMFYKLCERGEGTLPLYLVDKQVSISSLALWNGVVRSVASIGGSAVGGYLLSSQHYSPSSLMLHTAVLRIIPITAQLLIIHFWGHDPVSDTCWDNIMFYLAIISLCVGNFSAGLITTATFTSMMSLSQSAQTSIQTSHYSLLATAEVLGKLMFASVAGALIDMFGLELMFVLFVLLAVLTVPLLWRMPDLENTKVKTE